MGISDHLYRRSRPWVGSGSSPVAARTQVEQFNVSFRFCVSACRCTLKDGLMCVLDGAVRRLAGVFNCGPRRELRDTPTVCFVSCFFLWRFIADRIGRMSLVRRTGHAAFAGCMSRNNYRRSIFSFGRGAGRSLLDEGFCPLLGCVGSSDSAIMAYGVALGTGSTGYALRSGCRLYRPGLLSLELRQRNIILDLNTIITNSYR